jgi:hypothetical protein
MHTQPEGEPDRTKPEAPREPYTSPQLVRHGTIEDLTRGSQPSQLQIGDFISAPPPPHGRGGRV